MKSIKIHGRDYYPVAERLKEFREKHGHEFSIESQIIELSDDLVTIQASIKKDGVVISDGIAHKKSTWGGVHAKNHIEFCQTSAIGRALAYFGIGVTDDIASADEMQGADLPKAGYEQISLIESLLQKASIPDKDYEKISRELKDFGPDTASRCIKYLKDNQVTKKLNDELTDKLEQDDYRENKLKQN